MSDDSEHSVALCQIPTLNNVVAAEAPVGIRGDCSELRIRAKPRMACAPLRNGRESDLRPTASLKRGVIKGVMHCSPTCFFFSGDFNASEKIVLFKSLS